MRKKSFNMMKSEQLLNLNNEIKFKKKVYNANEAKKNHEAYI